MFVRREKPLRAPGVRRAQGWRWGWEPLLYAHCCGVESVSRPRWGHEKWRGVWSYAACALEIAAHLPCMRAEGGAPWQPVGGRLF